MKKKSHMIVATLYLHFVEFSSRTSLMYECLIGVLDSNRFCSYSV